MRSGREPQINITEISEITQSLSSYYSLANYFTSIDKRQEDVIKKFVTQDGKYANVWDSAFMQNWFDVDLHVVDQMWGSTACGWSGIGGSAMTNKYNVIIENKRNKIFFVYWGGKLAYAAELTDDVDYARLPSMDRCEKKLNIIYKYMPYERK